MTSSDNYWTEMVGKLGKTSKIWARLLRILGKERVNPRVLGMFFKAVVKAVIIFGSEVWVMTP